MSNAGNAFALLVQHGEDLWQTIAATAALPEGVDPRDAGCATRCWFRDPNAPDNSSVAMFDTADGSNGLTIDDYDAATGAITVTFALEAERVLQIPPGAYMGSLLLDRITNDPTRPTDRTVISEGTLTIEWGPTR